MKEYLLKRLFVSLPVIIGVATLVFLLIHLIPGDPVDLLLGDTALDLDRESMRRSLGLHLSLFDQYILFWKQIFNGTWGFSISENKNVLSLILQKFPMTLLLASCSLVVGCMLSFPLGVWAANKHGTLTDTLIMIFALMGLSVPLFVMAPFMILFFSIKLSLLPVSGFGGWQHLVLPSVCLGAGMSGVLTRMIRSSVLETLKEDFVRTARAKGLAEKIVLFKHTLRNGLIPVVTLLAIMLGNLLAGAVITETIFDWPGLGKLFFSSFQNRDYPLVQGIVLWTSVSYVLINIFVDVFYSLIDPRIRLEDKKS